MHDVTGSTRALEPVRTPVVVLDAMGVIYRACDDVVELLIPFARERGCGLTDAEITAFYTECSLGLYTAAEFWARLGLHGSPEELDREYLRRHMLNPGLLSFLKGMQQRSIPVGCISNDVSEWSLQLRRGFALEPYFFHWTISGDVRIRKPDAGIYESFLQQSGAMVKHCMFVDDRPKNLHAARQLGFRTVLFSAAGASGGQGSLEHDVVSDFKELEQWVYNFNCAPS